MLSNFGDCVQYKEIVKSSLGDLISDSKDVQEEAEKILDTENLFEAQQLLLHHQVGCPLSKALMWSSLVTDGAREVKRTACPLDEGKEKGSAGRNPGEWLKKPRHFHSLFNISHFRRPCKINSQPKWFNVIKISRNIIERKLI